MPLFCYPRCSVTQIDDTSHNEPSTFKVQTSYCIVCVWQCCILGGNAAFWEAMLHSGRQCCILGGNAAFWEAMLHSGRQCCIDRKSVV